MSRFTCSPRRLAAVATLACAAALAPAAAVATPALAAPAAAPAPHLVGCDTSDSVRPSLYNPICNDGAWTVIHLSWFRWAQAAEGRGEFYTHTCVPSCAQGTVRLYRVRLSAWRARAGDYTRLRYYFPDRVPAGFSRSWTIAYYGHQWHGRVV
jgi:hypothetical protein